MADLTGHRLKNNFLILALVYLAFILISISTGYYWMAIVPFAVLLCYFGLTRIDVVFLILIFSLPWSIEYKFTSVLGSDLPDEPLMLLISVLCLAWLAWEPRVAQQSLKHPLFICLVLHVVWMTATVLFSTNEWLSLKFLLAKGWYIIAFVITTFFIFRNKKNITNAALVFSVSMLIVTIIILFHQYQLRFVFERVNESVQPFFRNHVNYSAMLVCSVPVWIGVYSLNKTNASIRSCVFIILLVLAGAVFLSYSRGAWIALVIGLAAYWLIGRKLLFMSFLISILLFTVMIFWLKSDDRYLQYAPDYNRTIYHADFREHLAATYQLKDVSTAERFNRWIAAVRMFRDKPITGYGPNSFYDNYKQFTVPAFKTWVSRNEDHSTVHNYYLLVMVEQGAPGLILFLILVGAMLYYAERLYHQIKDRFYRVAAITTGSVLTMILVLNFLSDLIETDKIGSLFFLSLAVLVATDLNKRQVSGQG